MAWRKRSYLSVIGGYVFRRQYQKKGLLICLKNVVKCYNIPRTKRYRICQTIKLYKIQIVEPINAYDSLIYAIQKGTPFMIYRLGDKF